MADQNNTFKLDSYTLVDAAGTLPRTLDTGETVQAGETIRAMIARIETLIEGVEAERRDADALREPLQAVNNFAYQLSRSVRMLGIAACSAHIAAAGSGQPTLLHVAAEASRLSEEADTSTDRLRRALQELSDAVARAAALQSRFCGQWLAPLRRVVSQSHARLAEFDAERDRARVILSSLEQAGRNANDNVVAAIVALQVGDATHQRVDHVEQLLAAACDPGDSADPMFVQDWAAQLAEAQLDRAGADFDGEAGHIEEALDNLRRVVAALGAEGADASGSTGAVDVVARLRSEVGAGLDALAAYDSDRARVRALIERTAECSEVVLREVACVQVIEWKMRLLGLNAAICCARLGDGASGFYVIAQQLRQLTEGLLLHSTSGSGAVERLVGLAGGLRSAEAVLAQSPVAAAREEAETALQAFAANQRDLAGADARSRALVAECVTCLQAALVDPAECLALRGAMEAARQALSDMGRCGEVRALSDAERAAFDALRKGYTISVEREVHDRTLAPLGLTLPDAAPGDDTPVAADADFDSVLF